MSIHAGTAQDRGDTTIGNGNLFLAYTHVAHDCVVGNFTTFSNNAQIAGHVHIDDWVVLGAYSGVHQFGRVGAHAMVGAYRGRAAGRAAVHDGRPDTRPSRMAPTTRACAGAASPTDDILEVRRAYKTLYRENLTLDDARAKIAAAAAGAPVLAPLVEFLAVPGRGIVR